MDELQAPGCADHGGIVSAPGLQTLFAEHRDALDRQIDWRDLIEQQVIALARGAADRVLAAGAEPEGRVGPLRRRRLDDDILVVPALAVMREPCGARPRLANNLHRLIEALGRFGHRHAEAAEFLIAIAFADAEFEAPIGEKIDRRGGFGYQNRVVPGEHDDRRAKPNALRAGGEIGEEPERSRNLADAGEVMLDDEDAAKAQILGLAHIGDVVEIALAVADRTLALGPRTTEETKLHHPNLGEGRADAQPGKFARRCRGVR